MKTSLPDFTSSRVLVMGDLMLDRYWHGPTQRISPEAPVPVVNIHINEERPGGAGNVALNIADLGSQVTLLGLTGEDEAANSLEGLLKKPNIECRFMRLQGQTTITKLRVISRHQQLIRLDFEGGFDRASASALNKTCRELIAGHGALVLSDYGKGTLADIAEIINVARKANVSVLVDPKGCDFSRYRGATVITPNQAEFEAVVGYCADEKEIIERGQKLVAELQLEALLITRSEKGVLLLQRNKSALKLPTRAREVYDVTGAGDTVISVLGAALAAGATLADATALANTAAGIVVGKLGTATTSVTELEAALREHEPLQRGVIEEELLLEQIAAAKCSGERIVFTNGCFDILHAGHVAYLSQAADLGDRLVVAVNDDDSVKRLKGNDRPVNGLMQRMAVLSGLESVDWVVPFSEDTPARIIKEIMPDVLVKGGDYLAGEIVGADIVKNNGGDIVVLDFIDGCSTSKIIESIRKPV
ncbi:MAG: bifunctional D-glycero-beta-D-manno-heptose-7-phosphate kinase/D-glycero-beta-D-manno-heptose 1-phosphate adenylyltransferase HldE [Gammaproteobacteria bacterium]|nr:bifunctional D-glycero-beta-D-manno-heptose-7-phosphate kinase/D-glycero-beta-D-manno-heptose 1-phosphate adenylyltransferase HldE [Gammaproteobacteria bacterium]